MLLMLCLCNVASFSLARIFHNDVVSSGFHIWRCMMAICSSVLMLILHPVKVSAISVYYSFPSQYQAVCGETFYFHASILLRIKYSCLDLASVDRSLLWWLQNDDFFPSTLTHQHLDFSSNWEPSPFPLSFLYPLIIGVNLYIPSFSPVVYNSLLLQIILVFRLSELAVGLVQAGSCVFVL